MKNTRLGLLAIAATLAFGAAGCGAKPKKEITERQRKEAAHLMSEGEFATSVRDWSRAESVFAKAAQLCPDTGEYWISLGSTRVRLGNKSGAKEAYQNALKAFAAEAEENTKDAEAWIKQAHVLALLGRVEDGRALLRKAAKQFPADPNVRAFTEGKHFDRLLERPEFKQMAL